MTVVDASQLFGTLPKWGKILFEVKSKLSTLGYVSSGLTWLRDQWACCANWHREDGGLLTFFLLLIGKYSISNFKLLFVDMV